MTALIALTQGHFAKVSDEDYARVSAFKWYAARVKRGAYIYACRGVAGRRLGMHTFLAGMEGCVVDHINGDTLDNRRENLRAVSYSTNAQNITKPPRGNTGVRNVYRNRRGHYIAKLVRDGRQHYLGSFRSVDAAQAAIAAYSQAAA